MPWLNKGARFNLGALVNLGGPFQTGGPGLNRVVCLVGIGQKVAGEVTGDGWPVTNDIYMCLLNLNLFDLFFIGGTIWSHREIKCLP